MGFLCFVENVQRFETCRNQADEVPSKTQGWRGDHHRQRSGHDEEPIRGLPRPQCTHGGAEEKPPTCGIAGRGHPFVVFPRSKGGGQPRHGQEGGPVVFERPFFLKPLMKEDMLAHLTCNDEGLCRML